MPDPIIIPNVVDVVVVTTDEEVVISPVFGEPGLNGSPGVHIGPTPPSDTSLLWVDTS